MSDRSLNAVVIAALLALATVAPASMAGPHKDPGHAKWLKPRMDESKLIVITVRSSPLPPPGAEDPALTEEEAAAMAAEAAEPACVAVQLGINLLSKEVPSGDGTLVKVKPADQVVLFPTLSGVEIVNPANQQYLDETPLCDTPKGPATATLNQLLGAFVDMGGEVVVCPLCALSRGIGGPSFDAPSFGDLGTGEEIHKLFLYADKVIDF